MHKKPTYHCVYCNPQYKEQTLCLNDCTAEEVIRTVTKFCEEKQLSLTDVRMYVHTTGLRVHWVEKKEHE